MKNKNILKKITKCLLVATFLMGNMIPAKVDLQAATVRQYFWSSLYDSESKRFVAKIIEDDVASPDEGTYSRLNTTDVWFELAEKPSNKNKIVDDSLTGSSGWGNRLDVYSYTFPGTIANEDQKAATAQDQQMASYVANTLTNSLNNAILKISSECKLDIRTMTDKEFLAFATKVSNSAGKAAKNGSATETYDTKKLSCSWTFNSGSSDGASRIDYGYGKGTVDEDFVTLSMGGKDFKTDYQFKAPKGYSDGQHLASTFEGIDKTTWMNEKLSWSHVLYQAKYSYANNITADDGNASTMSRLEKEIGKIFSGFINGLTGQLGLFSFDELMLNLGNRAIEYYEGIMPRGWFSAVSLVYVLCMAVALIVIGYAIVKLMIQKNLSTINATQKVSLMEGVKDFAVTAGMLSLFYPAFLIVCKFNSLIVSGLGSLVMDKRPLQELLIGGNGLSGISLGSIVIAFIMLFICVKVNFTYIVRSVTIALLFATSPYFISTYSIPGKKEKFWSWFKEMLANIFMQSFDALIAVVLIRIMNDHPMRSIERIALGLALISLGSFFRNSVIRLGSDSEDVAGHATGIFATGAGNLMAGLIKGSSHNANKDKTSTNSSSSSTNEEGGNVVNPLALKNVGEGKNEFKTTLRGRIDNVKQGIDNWSKENPTASKLVGGVGHIGKGVGHTFGGLAQTGIAMGTQAVGGRSFVAEQAAAKSFEKAQDEIWDNGIASMAGAGFNAALDYFDNPGNEAYFNSEQLKERKITNIDHEPNAKYTGADGKARYMDATRIDYEEDTFGRNEALEIARYYKNDDDVLIKAYTQAKNKKGEGKFDTHGNPVMEAHNYTPKQLEDVALKTKSNEKFYVGSLYLGGEFADTTVHRRNFDVNGQTQTNWELKGRNGENMPLPDMYKQVFNK